MKLKTLSRINRVTTVIIGLLMLPFAVVHGLFYWLGRPFEWVYDDLLLTLRQRIGNRLLRMSDEEVDAIKAQLYVVNASNQCINPGDLSWIRGYNNTQERLMGKRKGRRKK